MATWTTVSNKDSTDRWARRGVPRVGIVVLALVPDGTIVTSVTGPPEVPSFFSSKAIDTVPAGSVAPIYPYVDSESTGFISAFFPNESAMLNQVVPGCDSN
jgi:hypothetical protein